MFLSFPSAGPAATGRIKTDWQLGNIQAAAPMPITSPGNDDDTGETISPQLRKTLPNLSNKHEAKQTPPARTQMVRRDPPDPPVPGVPGALRVRVHVLQPVLGTREGRRRGPGRGRAPQAVRAGARRMEPRQLQPAPARPLPRTGDKDHYRKGESQTGLFDEDRKALLPLPAKPFDVVTWTRMKADKYGNVTVQGRHRYAAGPEHAGHEMIVGLRALEVEILDAEGKRCVLSSWSRPFSAFSFSPCERRVSGRFGVGRSCWLLVIALVIA